MRETKLISKHEVRLSDQDFEDVIDAAGYGIGYWTTGPCIVGDRKYTVTEEESGCTFTITHGDLEWAWARLLNGEVKVNTDYYNNLLWAVREADMGEIDASLADVLVQVACFDEIVYG